MVEIMISLCDVTGIMAIPWTEAGYTCYCVDLKHSVRKDRIVKHGAGCIIYTYGDARSWVPPDNTRIVFTSCFPTCTDMAGSGAQDYSNKKGTPKKGLPQLTDGLMLFNSCYHAAKWSGEPFLVENPVGVISTHFRKPDYYFQPWQFGDLYTKKTCLWAGNGFIMPPSEFITAPEGTTQKIWEMSPGTERQSKRSETPAGFARAVFEANNPLKLKQAI